MSFLVDVLVFLAVLGLMVVVHELGHFIVARRVGVKVLKFSLGMGPKIIGTTRGETEYVLSAVPFGGYVKMLGESTEEEGEEPIPPEDLPRSFMAQTPGKQLAIVFAGPLMNLLLAVILAPIFYMIGINVPAYLKKAPIVEGI